MNKLVEKIIMFVIAVVITITMVSGCERIEKPYVSMEFAKSWYCASSYEMALSDWLRFEAFTDVYEYEGVTGEINRDELVSINDYNYYDMRISGNKNLLLRLYFYNKETDSLERLWKAVFIYNKLYNTDIIFEVGQNASAIDNEYQKIHHISEDLFSPDLPDYFIDIVNQSGWHRYYCKNNIITTIEKII